jgi:hypothetical protein
MLNRMDITILPQQVGWLDGKRIYFHPWRFKDQYSQLAWAVVNNGMLTQYSLPTHPT